MEDIKKIKSLLKYYKKNNVEIQLKCNCSGEIIVNGLIKNNGLFFNYIILKSLNTSPIKIFLEDIYPDSIIPSDFKNKVVTQSDKKRKNKRSPIPSRLRHEILRRDKGVCQNCGACSPNVDVEVDHIIPISRGGTDTMDNLQTLCFKCNRGKGDSIL